MASWIIDDFDNQGTYTYVISHEYIASNISVTPVFPPALAIIGVWKVVIRVVRYVGNDANEALASLTFHQHRLFLVIMLVTQGHNGISRRQHLCNTQYTTFLPTDQDSSIGSPQRLLMHSLLR